MNSKIGYPLEATLLTLHLSLPRAQEPAGQDSCKATNQLVIKGYLPSHKGKVESSGIVARIFL